MVDVKQRIKQHRTLVENFSYITMLEVFLLIAPLITYPYLVRLLGMDLYGLIITAQALAGYATIIIDFGSNSVCAKHVSQYRDNKAKLSEIVCSVLILRSLLWIACLAVYVAVVMLVPVYRSHLWLFLLSYGLTFNDVLFPQYFFQGIEKMKYTAIINLIVKLVFIVLVFVVVRNADDYLFVPLLYTIGYVLAGILSLRTIFKKMEIPFTKPSWPSMMVFVKDSAPIFLTNLICTIKDKLNYFLIGGFSGMGNVVVYDLGIKINSILVKPVNIISTVLFPYFALKRDTKKLKKIIFLTGCLAVLVVVAVNIFLTYIVDFFVHQEIDLMPLRLFTLAPIFLSISSLISSNLFVAFGYNRYVLYSILVTTTAYFVALAYFFFTHQMNSVYSFVMIALASYFVEFVYRMIVSNKIIKIENAKR